MREQNNSSAAELEHKAQRKFNNIGVLMGIEYGLLFLYNYKLFKIELREVQLCKNRKVMHTISGYTYLHGKSTIGDENVINKKIHFE